MTQMTTERSGLAHGILHCNINTVGVSASHDFYAGLLGLTRRMRTLTPAGDGAMLGIDGDTDSETWFLYDERGPRVAPALELVQWNSPAVARRSAPVPGHTGLLAVGFRVPSLEGIRLRGLGPDGASAPAEQCVLPYRGERHRGMRVTDPDGVPVELVQHAESATVLSHLRIGCHDLARSAACYAALGFQEVAGPSRVEMPEAEVSTVSLGLSQDPSFTLELVEWRRPVKVTRPSADAGNAQGLYRIALGCEDVKEAHSALLGTPGWQVGEPLWVPMPGSPLPGLTVLFMTGPDEVVVELVERPATALTHRH